MPLARSGSGTLVAHGNVLVCGVARPVAAILRIFPAENLVFALRNVGVGIARGVDRRLPPRPTGRYTVELNASVPQQLAGSVGGALASGRGLWAAFAQRAAFTKTLAPLDQYGIMAMVIKLSKSQSALRTQNGGGLVRVGCSSIATSCSKCSAGRWKAKKTSTTSMGIGATTAQKILNCGRDPSPLAYAHLTTTAQVVSAKSFKPPSARG